MIARALDGREYEERKKGVRVDAWWSLVISVGVDVAS